MLLTTFSPLSKIISTSIFFQAHATTFGLMLDHGVIDVHAKFHRQVLVRG
jgi:hypothetical protein